MGRKVSFLSGSREQRPPPGGLNISMVYAIMHAYYYVTFCPCLVPRLEYMVWGFLAYFSFDATQYDLDLHLNIIFKVHAFICILERYLNLVQKCGRGNEAHHL